MSEKIKLPPEITEFSQLVEDLVDVTLEIRTCSLMFNLYLQARNNDELRSGHGEESINFFHDMAVNRLDQYQRSLNLSVVRIIDYLPASAYDTPLSPGPSGSSPAGSAYC